MLTNTGTEAVHLRAGDAVGLRQQTALLRLVGMAIPGQVGQEAGSIYQAIRIATAGQPKMSASELLSTPRNATVLWIAANIVTFYANLGVGQKFPHPLSDSVQASSLLFGAPSGLSTGRNIRQVTLCGTRDE
jgi:hypothetical protein